MQRYTPKRPLQQTFMFEAEIRGWWLGTRSRRRLHTALKDRHGRALLDRRIRRQKARIEKNRNAYGSGDVPATVFRKTSPSTL